MLLVRAAVCVLPVVDSSVEPPWLVLRLAPTDFSGSPAIVAESVCAMPMVEQERFPQIIFVSWLLSILRVEGRVAFIFTGEVVSLSVNKREGDPVASRYVPLSIRCLITARSLPDLTIIKEGVHATRSYVFNTSTAVR